jgi:hypothetical protein
LSAVALGSSVPALAQPTSPPPAPPPQVGFERHAQLSAQEEVAQATAMLNRIEQAGNTVRRQLDTARQGRDVVKSLCLSDKLSQVDVAGRSAKERESALQSAAQRNDSELANHEFAILTVLRQRTEQLVSEAGQCIGEEVAFVGQTIVSMTEANVPSQEETTGPPPQLPPAMTAPPAAQSPTH